MKALGGRGTFAILLLATRALLTVREAGEEEGAANTVLWLVASAWLSLEPAVAAGEAAGAEGLCAYDMVT